MVGVFILTLPIPIVVNSFASYYKNRLWRNEVALRREEKIEEQERKNIRKNINRMTKVALRGGAAAGIAGGSVHEEKTTATPNEELGTAEPNTSSANGPITSQEHEQDKLLITKE